MVNSVGSGSRLSAVSVGLTGSWGAGTSRLVAELWLKIAMTRLLWWGMQEIEPSGRFSGVL
jgi:hypothetical protein